jgi:basic amino acid/polyamine antiporter, APA family
MTIDGRGSGSLRRSLGVREAVVVGVGSMVGAGVYTVWGPAASAAGTGLLYGLILAGAIALANALASAQLAAVHPESGGTYVYARERLGPVSGYLAGWCFVVGKTASCAAMALAIGTYLTPGFAVPTAGAAVVVTAIVNHAGLRRTVVVTFVLISVSVVVLSTVVIGAWFTGSPDFDRVVPSTGDPGGILRSAGLLFFAFAGYARIATMGEEVRDPATTIPRAIPRALVGVLVLYTLIAVVVLAVVPLDDLAGAPDALRLVADATGSEVIGGVVRFGAAIASFGVLLNLVPGIARTVLAMGRRGELPSGLAHVSARRNEPVVALSAVVVAVLVLVAIFEIRSALAVSGVGVLTYYALTNASALRLVETERIWPRAVSWFGLVGCAVLVAALPRGAQVGGAVAIVTGLIVRSVTLVVRERRVP